MKEFEQQMSCDVVGDLLPSYLEGLCTDASRRLVEAHLEDCPTCAEKTRRLRKTILSGQGLEGRALDAAKKIRRRILLQTGAAVFLLGFQCLAGLEILLTGPWGLDPWHYAWFAATLALCALLSAVQKKPMENADRCLLLPAGLLAVLSAALPAVSGAAPLPLGEAALCISVGLYLIQLALLALGLYRMFRRSVRSLPLLAVGQTGMFLCLHWGPLLRFVPQLWDSWGVGVLLTLVWTGLALTGFGRALPRLSQGGRDRLGLLAGTLVLLHAARGVYLLNHGSSSRVYDGLWLAAALLFLVVLSWKRPGQWQGADRKPLALSLGLGLCGMGLMVWVHGWFLLRSDTTAGVVTYNSPLFGPIPWGDFPVGLVLEGLYTILYLAQLAVFVQSLSRLLAEKKSAALPGMAAALAGMFSLAVYGAMLNSMNVDGNLETLVAILLQKTAGIYAACAVGLVLAVLAGKRGRSRG